MRECSKCRSCYDDNVESCPLDSNSLVFTIAGSSTISGRYLLESRLGQGGMGIVFKAKHKFLRSSHAIKIILPSLVNDDKSLLVRFRQEAVLAASIDHPNVIRVTDFGVENDIMPFLVMEFVSGIPLSVHLVEGRPLPLSKAYAFFLPVALGVAEAHRKGIIHRDLKPQNIMVQAGLPLRKAVKVLDFGLAKIKSVESYPSLIQAKTLNILGSPPYMSPEQWSDEDVDHRTDIYALGVLLYQMLAGNLPFQADSMPAMMYQHLTAVPPTTASFGVSIPEDVEAVLRKALEKSPANRYASLELLLTDLDRAVSNADISALTTAETEQLIPIGLSGARITKPADTVVQLSDSQKERFYSYFGSEPRPDLLGNQTLAHEFLEVQDKVELFKTQAVEADHLVRELAIAQRQAEEAQERALQAKQQIEADVRRQVEAEMERLVADERSKREAEARRIAEEVEARRQAEERANRLAQAALEAQKLAENERIQRVDEAHKRELHEEVRRQAEIAAQKLAEQVADAKRQYESARTEAEREAELRQEAEAKRLKIERDLQAVAHSEAERRKLLEAEAKRQIQEQAERYEKEALAAHQRLDEARRLIELEAKKREEAETARRQAEEEAKRLAQEIIEVQKQMHAMQSAVDSHSRNSTADAAVKRTSIDDISFDNSRVYESEARENRFDTVPGSVHSTQVQDTHPSAKIPASLLDTGSTRNKKMILLPLAGLAGLLILVAVGASVYFIFLRPGNVVADEQRKNGSPTNTPSVDRTPTPRETVLIQGGTFQMGRSDVPDRYDEFWGNQFPAHPVTVAPFYIDKTETTNEQYAEFVLAENHKAPGYWINAQPPAGREKYPVTDVTLADANAYAAWMSKRENKTCHLPTEEQWEFAARNGVESTTFPWGNDWRDNAAVLSTRIVPVGTSGDQTKVGGIEDMLGNVSEWTTSRLALYKGHNGNRSADNKYISVRGLNWYTPANLLKKPELLLTYRNPTAEDEKNQYLGFRLVCEP